MLTVTHTDLPAFNTRSHTKEDTHNTTPTPHPDVSPKISPEATNPNTKTPNHRQIASITANAEDLPILYEYL